MSQIIGASLYSTTMHSVVWRKIAGLRSLMAATKVCFLVMKELNLIRVVCDLEMPFSKDRKWGMCALGLTIRK
jgi:hypothetical protein